MSEKWQRAEEKYGMHGNVFVCISLTINYQTRLVTDSFASLSLEHTCTRMQTHKDINSKANVTRRSAYICRFGCEMTTTKTIVRFQLNAPNLSP